MPREDPQEIGVAELLRTQSSRNAPTLRIAAAGAEIAYWEFGPPSRYTGGLQKPVDLSQFTGPVLIVHGDNDRMVPPQRVRTQPAATERVGHAVPGFRPRRCLPNDHAFVDAARDFLRR